MKRGRKNGRGGKRLNTRSGFSNSAGDVIRKRLTYTGLSLATGAGTAIPITNLPSGGVQSLPALEWASFAARYQQYRVRAVRVTGLSTQPIQSTTVSHSSLYRGDYLGVSAPATAAEVFADENVRTCSTHTSFQDVVNWSRNPNAKLWNPTSAAIPAANLFSWVAASATAPALTTGTTYYSLTFEWDVEFRGSQ